MIEFDINHYLIGHGTEYIAEDTVDGDVLVTGPDDFAEVYDAKSLLGSLKICHSTSDVVDVLHTLAGLSSGR